MAIMIRLSMAKCPIYRELAVYREQDGFTCALRNRPQSGSIPKALKSPREFRLHAKSAEARTKARRVEF